MAAQALTNRITQEAYEHISEGCLRVFRADIPHSKQVSGVLWLIGQTHKEVLLELYLVKKLLPLSAKDAR